MKNTIVVRLRSSHLGPGLLRVCSILMKDKVVRICDVQDISLLMSFTRQRARESAGTAICVTWRTEIWISKFTHQYMCTVMMDCAQA